MTKLEKSTNQLKKKIFGCKGDFFLYEVGQYEEALTCLEKEIEVKKESFDSLYWKGIILYRLQNFPQALESMDKAYEIKYTSFKTLNEKANSLKSFKKFEKAIKNLDNAKKYKTYTQRLLVISWINPT